LNELNDVPDIGALMLQGDEVDRALARGVWRARLMHKKLGYPIVVWRDDKVVWVPAEEIEVDESDEDSAVDARP
jgi:hypothetical protein